MNCLELVSDSWQFGSGVFGGWGGVESLPEACQQVPTKRCQTRCLLFVFVANGTVYDL